jgi:hypothetical protein
MSQKTRENLAGKMQLYHSVINEQTNGQGAKPAQMKKTSGRLTCSSGTHDIEDSTHTVRYHLLEDSVLQ